MSQESRVTVPAPASVLCGQTLLAFDFPSCQGELSSLNPRMLQLEEASRSPVECPQLEGGRRLTWLHSGSCRKNQDAESSGGHPSLLAGSLLGQTRQN